MDRYLTKNLGVPSNRIQLLLGSKEHTYPDDPMYPSRIHIIGALLSLITNSEIVYGDNIIIYYAGHGSRYTLTVDDEDDESEYIEALCPIDRDTPGENGNPVPDISDRELNTILNLISLSKGHRITVILDCCHSGGVTRSLPEPGARTSPPLARATAEDMFVAGENALKDYAGYRSIIASDWLPDMNSHVIVAACEEHQHAKEKKTKREDGTAGYIGIFTDMLVRFLQSDRWKEDMTYTDLIHCLEKVSSQTPVVAGKHRDARLWYRI
ncbi:hypothetical protein EDD18DRAFT_1129682 [Armillaria luteobubalina]|uniref:Peptidase C14 caspase domain-containing protein n=1 Tax=Armillaria luteobubalina TaxID=153913 RepID=A0AA39QPV2_9AGAR|nr:hypothetical protein EDD18DRAFT_1129682 [Armillaria luteobubalina]